MKTVEYGRLSYQEKERIKSEYLKLYNQGLPGDIIRQKLNLSVRAVLRIWSNLKYGGMFESKRVKDKELLKKAIEARDVWRKLNSYQGACAGFDVTWYNP